MDGFESQPKTSSKTNDPFFYAWFFESETMISKIKNPIIKRKRKTKKLMESNLIILNILLF